MRTATQMRFRRIIPVLLLAAGLPAAIAPTVGAQPLGPYVQSASEPDATTWTITTYTWDDGWVEHASWETSNHGDAVMLDIDAWNFPPDYGGFWVEFDNVRAFGGVNASTGSDGLLDDFEDGVIAPVWVDYGATPGAGFSESGGVLSIEIPTGPCLGCNENNAHVGWAVTDFILHDEFDVQVDFSVSQDFHDWGFGVGNVKLFLVDEDGDALESSIRSGVYHSLELLDDGTIPFIHSTPTDDLDGRLRIVRTRAVREVEIDIKPGDYPNSINLESRGRVPVAILTTEQFDALTVDPVTVVFGGASPLRWAAEDVDFDGDTDLVFHFKTQDLELDQSSTNAVLAGSTFDGQEIEGTDSVNIVP